MKSSAYGKIGKLLCSQSDDEDKDNGPNTATMVVSGDTQQPWLKDFHGYLQSKDHFPANMTIIQWWGTNADRYPVWASLTWDYLSIMAMSISSECAFLSAGITISKHRNHLKPDIVKALQCLKCLIHRDLLFHEDPSVLSEVGTDGTGTEGLGTESEDSGWNNMIQDSDLPGLGLGEVDGDNDVVFTTLD